MKSRIAICALAGLGWVHGSAMAAEWPSSEHVHDRSAGAQCCSAKAEIAADARKELVGIDGFEFVGGEAGWELAQHKYELRGVNLEHAPDCPATLAKAKAEEVLDLPAG